MKALLTDGSGGVCVGKLAEPAAAPDQVVVEVEAVSVNRGELHLAGVLPAGSPLGWDVAGVVVTTAADGSGPPVGTRVAGLADRTGWAERVALSTARIAPVPDGVTALEAAALPVAGLTALYSLRRAGLLLGHTVLVTGAAGGVGRLTVQLAYAAGAHVIAWVGAASRMEGLAELGASIVRTYAEAGTEPVDLLVDGVGGDVLARAFAAVRPGGTVVCYGNTTRAELTLPPDWGRARPGVGIGSLFLFDEATRQPVARDLALLLEFVLTDRIDPGVDLTVPWTDPAPALAALRARHIHGKAILTFS